MAVVQALVHQRAIVDERRNRAGNRWLENDLVWPNTIGKIVDESRPEIALATALKTAGLPHLRVHDLRHAFVTNALEADVDLATVSRAAGHQSVRITADVYNHATNRADRKVANALDEAFSRAVGDTVSDIPSKSKKITPISRGKER